MTFLELCQRVAREAGLATQHTAVTGNDGDLERIADWVAEAWTEIQSHNDRWDFLWCEFDFLTVATYRDYDPSSTTANVWEYDTFKAYATADGEAYEYPLIYVPFSDWKAQNYELGEIDTAKPTHFTKLPNNRIRLNTYPDEEYKVQGSYYKSPIVLAADADTPAVGSQHHMAIAWLALKKYGVYEEAADVVTLAEREYDKMFTHLVQQELPQVTVGSAPLE